MSTTAIPGFASAERRERGRIEQRRFDFDDVIEVEAGHIGDEFRAGHDLAGEDFGVGARWVSDQRDETIGIVARLSPHAVDDDPELRKVARCRAQCTVAYRCRASGERRV